MKVPAQNNSSVTLLNLDLTLTRTAHYFQKLKLMTNGLYHYQIESAADIQTDSLSLKKWDTWKSTIIESTQKSEYHVLPVANLSTIDLVFIGTEKRIVGSSEPAT